mgnify:CR=1 FL=1
MEKKVLDYVSGLLSVFILALSIITTIVSYNSNCKGKYENEDLINFILIIVALINMFKYISVLNLL